MTDVQTLVDSHTRAELDQIATEAGVEGAAELPTKQDVAEAIAAADAAAGNGEAEETTANGAPAAEAFGDGWVLVQDGPDYFTAERYVESLGLQKVSEGAASLEELQARCADYDAHIAALPGSAGPGT